jgi:hypothetical protein
MESPTSKVVTSLRNKLINMYFKAKWLTASECSSLRFLFQEVSFRTPLYLLSRSTRPPPYGEGLQRGLDSIPILAHGFHHRLNQSNSSLFQLPVHNYKVLSQYALLIVLFTWLSIHLCVLSSCLSSRWEGYTWNDQSHSLR